VVSQQLSNESLPVHHASASDQVPAPQQAQHLELEMQPLERQALEQQPLMANAVVIEFSEAFVRSCWELWKDDKRVSQSQQRVLSFLKSHHPLTVLGQLTNRLAKSSGMLSAECWETATTLLPHASPDTVQELMQASWNVWTSSSYSFTCSQADVEAAQGIQRRRNLFHHV